LIFIDVEAGQEIVLVERFPRRGWIKTNMTRTCGWAVRGQRLTAHVPHGHWKTLTFLAGLRHDGIVAPFVLDGPINGDAFTAWVDQCLVSTLAPGDCVIADTLGSHKGQPARQRIRAARAHLLLLPPYSPDLNPIDLRRENGPLDRFLILLIFAKLKTLFRNADERTIEASWRRVGTLLDTFTPQECQNYLRHPGYASA
jgi:transposase